MVEEHIAKTKKQVIENTGMFKTNQPVQTFDNTWQLPLYGEPWKDPNSIGFRTLCSVKEALLIRQMP